MEKTENNIPTETANHDLKILLAMAITVVAAYLLAIFTAPEPLTRILTFFGLIGSMIILSGFRWGWYPARHEKCLDQFEGGALIVLVVGMWAYLTGNIEEDTFLRIQVFAYITIGIITSGLIVVDDMMFSNDPIWFKELELAVMVVLTCAWAYTSYAIISLMV